jgi:hypothetical protein
MCPFGHHRCVANRRNAQTSRNANSANTRSAVAYHQSFIVSAEEKPATDCEQKHRNHGNLLSAYVITGSAVMPCVNAPGV